jgi:phosphoglycolate phosphatase
LSSAKEVLLLFDIDGTLITSGSAGEHALKLAVKDLFGIEEDLSGISIAGRTDGLIARQILERYQLEANAQNITSFLDAYLFRLVEQLPKTHGTVLPGIVQLLEALKKRPDVALALLTGNISRGAELKLSHYGVWHFFDFGAYADDHYDRNKLGPFAQARAAEFHGVEFSADRTFVIGDTPYDIECGKVFGAKTVAVATGSYSRQQLAEHHPDILLDDLSDVESFIAALGI